LSARRGPIAFIAGLGYEQRPAPEVVESLLGAGYDAVEWTMAHLGDLREPAVALACQQDFVSNGDAALRATLEGIEAAAEAGIATVNVVAGPNLWEPGADARYDDDAWSAALGGLESACRRAEQLGVAIGFEPCWGTLAHDAETAQRVLDAVGVSVTFDPSHFVLEGEDIPELARRWGERIVHVHLKDAFGRPGAEGEDFHFCMLGEGRVPWAELLDALDEVGYAGPLSVEFEAYRYYELVLRSEPAAAASLAREQVAALIGEPPGGER
jgi:sugar phosphate isomerase/epimerase